MVIAPAQDAQKIGAGDDDAPPRAKHPGHLVQQSDGVLHMFQDVERTHHVNRLIGQWQCRAVIELKVARMLAGQGKVRL